MGVTGFYDMARQHQAIAHRLTDLGPFGGANLDNGTSWRFPCSACSNGKGEFVDQNARRLLYGRVYLFINR